jgi:hypothetical protein
MNLKKIAFILLFLLIGLAFMFGGYTYWNAANPEKTCASCHEISPMVGQWNHSAHREVRCFDCHGTALSNGFHSLKEKANMVFTHIGKNPNPEDIQMSESQVLELSDRCAKCHQSEYKKWLSGGHSARYADIFMNGKHNEEEAPYWACLRCHGMFYDGNIKTLMKKENGIWKLQDMTIASNPTVPCLACHAVHTDNELLGIATRYNIPKEIAPERQPRNPVNNYYVRDTKQHIRIDRLKKIAMNDQGRELKVSDDPVNTLCIQCHAPNFKHQAGSEDDNTPSGVHEGISCNACHSPHSNDARHSCKHCHPAISNCGLDVTKMNTSYSNLSSPNDIHSVSCGSCHADVLAMRTKALQSKSKMN